MTPEPFSRILVGYVATEQGSDALALGVELAAACHVELVLASIVRSIQIDSTGERPSASVVNRGEHGRAAAALEEAAQDLAGAAGLRKIERRLIGSSSPARGLHDLAVAEKADLIVVGSGHHGPLGQVLLRSVGERLLTGAPCAVAIAPHGYATAKPLKTRVVAVAFDDSPEARLALGAARWIAVQTDATLRAVMVIEPPSPIPGHFIPLPTLEPLIAVERGEALHRQELAAHSALEAAVHALGDEATVEQDVIVGRDPAAEILDATRAEVGLLVLGSRAYGPVRRALLGSVSTAILRHASCPVMVTPRPSDGAD